MWFWNHELKLAEWLVEKVIAALFTVKPHLRGLWQRSSIVMVFPSYDGFVRIAS